MEKRGLLITHRDLFILGQTNCMGNVTHYQFDILFGYVREKWALTNLSGLLQSLGKELNLETTETHKYLKKSFFLGDLFIVNLYVEELAQASFIFSADFIKEETGEVHVIMKQKIVSTGIDGKICRVPDALRDILSSKMT